MKTKRAHYPQLQKVRSELLAAVAELDLRGNDEQLTKAMCIIEAAFDAAIFRQKTSAKTMSRVGLSFAKSIATSI